MAGAYCQFCGDRCFVERWLPLDHPRRWVNHFATCTEGAANDLAKLGYNHETAFNPHEKWGQGETDTEREKRFAVFYVGKNRDGVSIEVGGNQ